MSNNLRTAEEYRAAAASSRKAEAESWERSDTDGYLSQWASSQMAHRYDRLAKIAEDGGKINVLALFLNGTVASLDQRDGQYGFYWILNDAAEAEFGKRFFNPSKAKNATDRDKARGFTYGYVRVDAFEDRNSNAQPDFAALKEGRYEIVATDGAYDGIDEVQENPASA